ncbi:MAG: lysylphosphatidylglycerol synthase transmembrane domain-containing protein [Pyrinomonadaceae bacterium]
MTTRTTPGDVLENDSKQRKRNTRKLAPLGILFALLGLLLFAYFVRNAGVSKILDGIKRLGAGFLLILAISAVRHVVRAFAWTKCFEEPYRLRFRDAFAARLMGDALGNIIPFVSMAVAEPSKAMFVRHRVPLIVGLSAIALENIFYSFSVVLFIFSGTMTLMLSFPLPPALRYLSIGALVITAAFVPVVYLIINKQWRFLSGALAFFGAREFAKSRVEKTLPRARILEDRVYGFYQRNRRLLIPIFGLELCFHLAGVLEIYTTLSFISDVIAPTILAAFILESVNRIINVVFKFIPFRLGVDEGGSGLVSKILGLTRPVGVTLAIVRKARDLFWTAVGVVLMIRRGLSPATALTEEEPIVEEAAG